MDMDLQQVASASEAMRLATHRIDLLEGENEELHNTISDLSTQLLEAERANEVLTAQLEDLRTSISLEEGSPYK